jgi:hypothetical protein
MAHPETEEKIKEETKATITVYSFGHAPEEIGLCVYIQADRHAKRVIFAKAY